MEHDEFGDLPENPELAWVTFADRERSKLREYSEMADGIDAVNDARMRYFQRVMAFHDAQGFDFLKRKLYRSMSLTTFEEAFKQFEDDILYYSTQIRIRHSQRSKRIAMILAFTPDIRAKIHHFINLIRETIHGIELPKAKKEAILMKLNALADEVDRDRTRSEALMALAMEVADTGGEIGKKLNPLKKLVDSITNIFAQVQETMEELGLPGPGEQKQVEGPRKQLPSPEQRKSNGHS